MDCCKNSMKNKEIMISDENIEKSLQDWRLPRSSASDVFKRRGIFSFSPDWEVKTVEKEIPLNEGYTTISLIPQNLKHGFEKNYTYLHVGMIQVGLKPKKLGSKISAIICLRDKRFLKFDQSSLAMVESRLSDGPIYFSYFPTHCVSLSDPHLSSTFVIDIKTEGSSGDEGIILMYRFHYKVTESYYVDKKKLSRSLVDEIGETTLFIADVAAGGNRVVSKKITWDEVAVPERWMVRDKVEEWKETAEAYVLEVDVGGLKKEEVKVEVEDGRFVVISVESSREEEGKRNILEEVKAAIERSIGKFPRRLRLPENAKSEELKAAMENGVLTVTVPKEEAGRKMHVKVVDISG